METVLSSPVLFIWAVAWLLLALVADWPVSGPIPLKQILRIVIEVLALIFIALWPQISSHVR